MPVIDRVAVLHETKLTVVHHKGIATAASYLANRVERPAIADRHCARAAAEAHTGIAKILRSHPAHPGVFRSLHLDKRPAVRLVVCHNKIRHSTDVLDPYVVDAPGPRELTNRAA